jgi:hypothetical protein
VSSSIYLQTGKEGACILQEASKSRDILPCACSPSTSIETYRDRQTKSERESKREKIARERGLAKEGIAAECVLPLGLLGRI